MTGFFKTSDKTKPKPKDITLEVIITELESARLVAMAKGNASAMISATLAKAKLLGLDKVEQTTHQNMSLIVQFENNDIETAKAEFEKVAKEVLQMV